MPRKIQILNDCRGILGGSKRKGLLCPKCGKEVDRLIVPVGENRPRCGKCLKG